MRKKYSPREDPVIKEFAQAVRQVLGPRVKSLYLYGSRARGDAWDGSDYDYAIIVDERDHNLEERVFDVAYRMLDEHDELVSPQIFAEEEWELEKKLPLGKNIIKEGIAY